MIFQVDDRDSVGWLDHAQVSSVNGPCGDNPEMVSTQAKRKRQHMGDLKIVVAGCVAQQEGAALLRRVPEVDLVMGPQYANRSAFAMPTDPPSTHLLYGRRRACCQC